MSAKVDAYMASPEMLGISVTPGTRSLKAIFTRGVVTWRHVVMFTLKAYCWIVAVIVPH